MNPRAFTRLVGDTHEHWLGTILSLTNVDRGIDLVGDKLCVELKSRYDKWNPNWAVDNKEYVRFPKENPNKELYWAFILYGLRTSPIDIPRGDVVEKYITVRNIWFTRWQWIRKFEYTNPNTGPYRHVGKRRFPPQYYFSEHFARKGHLFVPKGSLLERQVLESPHTTEDASKVEDLPALPYREYIDNSGNRVWSPR